MSDIAARVGGLLPLTLRLVVILPACLLIYYHLIMAYDILAGRGLSDSATYNAVQLVLRLSIAVSLIGAVAGVRIALWTMWASIAVLVITQYWAHFGWVQADFTADRHPLSYLKGFIIPSIITAATLWRSRLLA